MIGQFLGEGKSRKVYDYLPDPNWVIKINKNEDDTNLAEFQTFQLLTEHNLGKWLSPCKYIDGQFLMRKASKPVPGSFMIPRVFSNKLQNWGVVDDSLVRIDYAWSLSKEDGINFVVVKPFTSDTQLLINELHATPMDNDYFKIKLTPSILQKLFNQLVNTTIQ